MSSHPEGSSRNPFIVSTENDELSVTGIRHGHPTTRPLPEGWHRLSTGLRGARLYRVTPRMGGGNYWVAAMKLDGKDLGRRFASELHARAWLTAAADPRSPVADVDLEEAHGPFRTAGVAAAGHAEGVQRVG